MPRQTVISFPLTESCGETWFYNDKEENVAKINYDGYGAVLNTGEHFHNVYFTEDDNTRIVFQLCFEETYNEVCNLYEEQLKGFVL